METNMQRRLLSHRGCWKQGYRKNSIEAIERSFRHGYGIETDIRDSNGELVVSHDIPVGTCTKLREVIKAATLAIQDQPVTLALNIKSDGLLDLLQLEFASNPDVDYFVFDMAIPDMRSYLKANIQTFTRLSDAEPQPAWLDQSQGVWLDAFETDWYSAEIILNLLARGKRVCVVSPELHGRAHEDLWNQLAKIWHNPQLLLCTDFPDEAVRFFSSNLD